MVNLFGIVWLCLALFVRGSGLGELVAITEGHLHKPNHSGHLCSSGVFSRQQTRLGSCAKLASLQCQTIFVT